MDITVKPLNWRGPSQKSFVAEPFPNFKYVIVDDERGVDWSIGGDGWNPVDSVEEAKSDAQSDYETRIRSALSTSQGGPAPEIAARRVKLTKEGARDAALDLVRKTGWKPGNSISLHSAVELMAAFGLMVDAGEVQCDWPNCGCCADAGCRDAVTFMDTEAEIAALRAENERLRMALNALVSCHDDFNASSGNMEEAYYKLAKYAHPQWQAARAAVAPEQEEEK